MGRDSSLTLSTTGATPVAQQYQKLTKNGWANISGGDVATLAAASAEALRNAHSNNVRCVVTFPGGVVVTTEPCLYIGQTGSRTQEANNIAGTKGVTYTDRTMHYIFEDHGPSNPLTIVYANYEVATGTSGPAGTGQELASTSNLPWTVEVFAADKTTSLGAAVAKSDGVSTTIVLPANTPTDAVFITNAVIPAGSWIQLRPSIAVGGSGSSAGAGVPFTRLSTTPAQNGNIESTVLGDGPLLNNGVTVAAAKIFPRELYGITRKPSMVVIADSKGIGQGDLAALSARGLTGNIAPSLGNDMAVCTVATASDRAAWFMGNNTMRLQRFKRGSHFISTLGTNDLNGGNYTAAQLMTVDGNMITAFAGIGALLAFATIEPLASASNGFAQPLGTGQTTLALNADRNTVNTARKAKSGVYANSRACYDLAGAVEYGDGLWNVGPNARTVTNAAASNGSPNINSATAAFTSADLGSGIYMTRASAGAAAILQFAIEAINSGTQAVMGQNFANNLTNETLAIGALTRDGIHGTPLCYKVMVASGVLTPAMITR